MSRIKSYLVLHLILMIYSLSEICSKTASGSPFLSFEFCMFYGLSLIISGVYAILWQQIIKKIPLNIAYANKAVTLMWGMVWGTVFFNEHISIANIIGTAIVMAGVLLMVTGGEKNE